MKQKYIIIILIIVLLLVYLYVNKKSEGLDSIVLSKEGLDAWAIPTTNPTLVNKVTIGILDTYTYSNNITVTINNYDKTVVMNVSGVIMNGIINDTAKAQLLFDTIITKFKTHRGSGFFNNNSNYNIYNGNTGVSFDLEYTNNLTASFQKTLMQNNPLKGTLNIILYDNTTTTINNINSVLFNDIDIPQSLINYINTELLKIESRSGSGSGSGTSTGTVTTSGSGSGSGTVISKPTLVSTKENENNITLNYSNGTMIVVNKLDNTFTGSAITGVFNGRLTNNNQISYFFNTITTGIEKNNVNDSSGNRIITYSDDSVSYSTYYISNDNFVNVIIELYDSNKIFINKAVLEMKMNNTMSNTEQSKPVQSVQSGPKTALGLVSPNKRYILILSDDGSLKKIDNVDKKAKSFKL